MNFYKRYPGDYAKKTARLTLAQHGAYTLLLDEIYVSEAPLPADVDDLYRICRAMTKAEQDAVRVVAGLFFPVGPDGLRHNERASEEMAAAAPAIEAARLNGKKGGRPKKEPARNPSENPVGFSGGTQNEPNSKAPQNSEIKPPIPPTPDGEGGKASRSSAVGLPAWLAMVKAKEEKAIPEGDPVFAYAEQAGLPMDFIRLAWREFRSRYSEPGAKKYRDWRSVFRKAVRGNWFKLWYAVGDGAYALTTTGTQARRVDERESA